MASRDEVVLLRAARTGNAAAQIELAKRYLSGSSGLPSSMATSLHWLVRAAQQGVPDAWLLIAKHIPFDIAIRVPGHNSLYIWYERAYDSGMIDAGVVFAKLVLAAGESIHDTTLRKKAMQALERVANHGCAEAQWLLAQQLETQAQPAKHGARESPDSIGNEKAPCRHLDWARRAAENGELQARRMLAEYAWHSDDLPAYLHWAVPLAHALLAEASYPYMPATLRREEDIVLLSRCVRALFRRGEFSDEMIEGFAEPAARAGDKDAQFYLGLWLAKMDERGHRIAGAGRHQANYRKAMHWLTLAGRQGVADAWYVAARITFIPQLAQHNIADAEKYLLYAAEDGHCAAQLEVGQRLWRKRTNMIGNDLRAVYWLQKATAHGCKDAAALLRKLAAAPAPAAWAMRALCGVNAKIDPLTAARLKLAACFGLTEREALMLDIVNADKAHCLEVNIGEKDTRTRRRLVLVQTASERQLLDQIKAAFEGVDPGPHGPEGNYRQRLYRLHRIQAKAQAKVDDAHPPVSVRGDDLAASPGKTGVSIQQPVSHA